MKKETFDKFLNLLKARSYDYSFDYYFDKGMTVMRGIYVNTDGKEDLKKQIDSDSLKNFKLQKSYNWYLGEKKKALYMKLKREFKMEIPEVESYRISNYA